MNVKELLWNAARSKKRALPVLSFPAAQKIGVSVGELVKNSAAMADAMEYVAHHTSALCAVSLMDLSVEAEAFGAVVRYSEDEIPAVLGQLVEDEDDAAALAVPSVGTGRTGICRDAIRLAKEKITDKPVLSGMIGPFSLAGRLMDVTEVLYACIDEPETVHAVLEKATEFLIAYGTALKEAGADGIVMAEPLAGIVGREMLEEFSVPYCIRIRKALQDDDFALIYHNCGNATLTALEPILSQGMAAYHFGNAVDLEKILQNAPADALILGNIDPLLFTADDPAKMAARTTALMNACGACPNFLPSSGCDIPHHAKWETIDAFFNAVDQYGG